MAHTVEEYLDKGLDLQSAEYFASGRKRIAAVQANDDFSLTISFDSQETRILDCRPFLKPGTVFAPFLDLERFKKVYVDSEHCIAWDIDPAVDSEKVWSNKVELCPDACYMDSRPV